MADDSIDTIRVRARTLNTSSGGRCWCVKKFFFGGGYNLLTWIVVSDCHLAASPLISVRFRRAILLPDSTVVRARHSRSAGPGFFSHQLRR